MFAIEDVASDYGRSHPEIPDYFRIFPRNRLIAVAGSPSKPSQTLAFGRQSLRRGAALPSGSATIGPAFSWDGRDEKTGEI